MKIALGSDHGGYALKCDIIQLLEKLGHEYEDFGCYSTDSCDYPDLRRGGRPGRGRRASVTGASSSAPPASASPLPPIRSRASAAPTAPTPWRRR